MVFEKVLKGLAMSPQSSRPASVLVAALRDADVLDEGFTFIHW